MMGRLAVHLAGIKTRTSAAHAWLRTRVTRRRVKRALWLTAIAGTVGITTEALVRGSIAPAAARAPSALYTRQEAWGGGEGPGSVAIASLARDLNELREPVRLDNVPKHLVDAVLAVEDKRFYAHHGLDAVRIGGALVANIKAVGFVEGGSTITQQLARNLFLTASKTPLRKLREAALAVAIEARHTKREILEAYLNEIYLGQSSGSAIHGVGAAARFYFGKPVGRLSLSESAMLAGMIRSPNRLAPTRHPRAARDRRNLVLGLMVAQTRLDGGVAEKARNARLPNRTFPARTIDARYFRDFVASSLSERVPKRGAAVVPTLDANLQRSAERAVVRGLARYGRIGAQAALVAIDPRTGEVLAMVGGSDYGASQFNRAVDARRQPGSAFKPFVALAALEAGAEGSPAFTLASTLEDAPLRVSTPQGDWLPANYDGGFRGDVTLREALEQSLNIPFARVGMAIGPARIASTAKRLGVTSSLAAVPSLALGSSEVTLLELVRAYGVLAAQGELAPTRAVTARVSKNGTRSEVPVESATRVAEPAPTFLVTSALMGAVQRGTGRALDAGRFYGDIAGKTGTSNDWRDAWFVAYSPTIVVGVWVGHDDGHPLGLAGGAAALPIVSEFFTSSNVSLEERFPVPDGIEERSVGGDGGWFRCGEREYFLEGTAPAGGGCGFRALLGDLFAGAPREREHDAWLERRIRDRIRQEIESLRHQRRY
jgi:penicillin-binding protein 1B